MTKYPMNGSGKKKTQLPQSMEGKEIEFPVTFPLKALMDATIEEDTNKERLVHIFKSLAISYVYRDKKISTKGKFVSFTYTITVLDKIQFEELYKMLRKLEGLKFAI